MRAGEYELGACLGEGAMGAVYEARHPAQPGRRYAVKVLRSGGALPPMSLARFQREMSVLASLPPHANVVRIHGGEAGGPHPYYVMEHVAGPSLAKLARDGTLDVRRAAALVRDAARGLAHAHARGVLHRDVKPANVLVDAVDGRARVCDFGVARQVESERLTRTGSFVGTPHYAAPEQLAGDSSRATAAADVYGLGGVLYYALTGRPPFDAASLDELMLKVARGTPERPSAARREVPAALDAICLRALEKEPSARHESAAALADELDAFLGGRSGVGRGGTAGTRRRRVPATFVFVPLAVAAVIALGVIVARRFAAERAAVAAAAELEAAIAEAEEPATRLEGLEEALRRIERLAPSDAERAPIAARVARSLARAVDRGEPSDRGAQRRKLIRLSRFAPAALSLVGEPGEPSGGLAERLLVPEERALIPRAAEIAAARLRVRADDPAGRALRAWARIAELGAPVRALGPGRLGLGFEDVGAVLGDLEAAAALPGEGGARALWLRVDLLAGMGQPGLFAAREALAAARGAGLAGPERDAFEALLEAAPPGRERAVALFERLVKECEAGSPAAPFALARLLAIWGAPGAIEHPELARDSTEPALAAALAADDREGKDEERFRYSGAPPTPSEAMALSDSAGRYQPTAAELANLPREELVARIAPARPILARALALAPRDPYLLAGAAWQLFDRLTRCVLLWLGNSGSLRLMPIAECFDPRDRDVVGRTNAGALGPKFDMGWEKFDAVLAEEVKADECIAAVLANGVPQEELDRIVAGMGGLKRLEALEQQKTLASSTRAAVAFDALLRIEGLARSPGPAVLPFRARLRPLALGERLGGALAALDLDRMVRVTRSVHEASVDLTGFLLLGASMAAERPPGSPCQLRWRALYELSLEWFREVSRQAPGLSDTSRSLESRADTLARLRGGALEILRLTRRNGTIIKLRGEERLREDFAVRTDDRAWLAAPRPFDPPRAQRE